MHELAKNILKEKKGIKYINKKIEMQYLCPFIFSGLYDCI